MKEVFLFLYLNNTNILHNNKGWNVSAIFTEFPTVEQILDHTCLESSNPNDVAMAKKLVESKGRPHRFVYKNFNEYEKFFECMIVPKPVGEKLNLWDYFITGYADMDKSCQLLYKDIEKIIE